MLTKYNKLFIRYINNRCKLLYRNSSKLRNIKLVIKGDKYNAATHICSLPCKKHIRGITFKPCQIKLKSNKKEIWVAINHRVTLYQAMVRVITREICLKHNLSWRICLFRWNFLPEKLINRRIPTVNALAAKLPGYQGCTGDQRFKPGSTALSSYIMGPHCQMTSWSITERR